MPSAIDGRGQRVTLSALPERIVSLVPSTTESLLALGCGQRVVGVTRFCVHPPLAKSLPKVGGTKDVEIARVAALAPDLVIGNVEENTADILAEIEQRWPLYASFPRTVDAAIGDLMQLGALLGVAEAAAHHVRTVEAARAQLHAAAHAFRYVYLIWRRPWMAVSGDTFISAMLAEAGGVNAFADHPERYFALTPAALAASGADVVLLSSEPFPFKERHRAELAAASGLPLDALALVDGELCSWHGTRMAEAMHYLRTAAGVW